MSLIVLEKVSLAYGSQRILRDASLRVDEGEKVGLIGPNGAGKSTLLRLIIGRLQPDEGLVRRSKHCRLGYLPQDVPDYDGHTVIDAVLSTVPGRLDMEQRLSTAERRLESTVDPDEQMALATEIAEVAERLTHLDTFYSEHQAIRILQGLGFEQADLRRPANELSGGWRMRVALAGLLFQQPDLLLLDEPTNHLDMPSVLWLDGFLNELRSATILICHDRTFLNGHVERVLSLEPEGLRGYKGNYDAYLKQRAEEEEIRSSERKNQERKLEEMERFVERFKSKATKARQAQSRARRVKRLKSELEEASPILVRRTLSFRFPPVAHSGRRVVEIDRLRKAFGERVLYDGVSTLVERGDRIAIVGRNGAGKTTLLRMLAGELAADEGRIARGAGVELGYYAQHHSDLLDARRSVLDEVWRVAPSMGQNAVRGVCGAFLFSRDEVEKVVGVLSGGERARVLLARLLVNPGNLLLMDEPTNHLDVTASEALAEALTQYDGTIVFVSHNTAFVERIATRIWEVGDGGIVDHPGDFASWRHHQTLAEAQPPSKSARRGANRDAVPEVESASSGTTVSARVLRERDRRARKAKESTTTPRKTIRRRRHRGDPEESSRVDSPSPSGTAVTTEPIQNSSPTVEVDGDLVESTGRRRRRRRRSRRPKQDALQLEARLQELQEKKASLEADLADLGPGDPGFAARFSEYRDVEAELERVEARRSN